MSDNIGVGFIGSGSILQAHYEAVSQAPGIELIGISSRNTENARLKAKELHCKVYDDYLDLIKDPAIQLVVLLTPPGVHHDRIHAALDRGKHLLVEKPIGTNLNEIDQYIEKAKEKGLLLSCISQHRFDEASQIVREKIDNGRLGVITGANCLVNWYRDKEYYESWRSHRDLSGGGVLSIQAIHTIDLMLWFMGEVDSVMGYTDNLHHKDIEVEDIAMAVIRFKNGSLANVSASTCTYPGYPARLDIFGNEGSLSIVGDDLTYYHSKLDKENSFEKNSSGETVDSPSSVSIEPIKLQYLDTLQAIKNKTDPLITGLEARKAYALLNAIYESTKTRQEVKL